MREIDTKECIWMTILTILCIICFPVNPLILVGWVDPAFYLPAFILGWLVWLVGKVLVLAPIVMFPHRGGVPRTRKSS